MEQLSNLSDLITRLNHQGHQGAVSDDRARAATINSERDMVWETSGSVMGISGPKGKGAEPTADKTQRGFLSSLGMSKASVL